ncbi:MAG: 4-(cytidine 5'-diphospho)-2-C-methyl-D-erythritol kinase [Firmicutes bacterium]|nr:4-(cytidine 5'-diphospho)-2-C-methyl-D-erythritol kinase [Bacillota bacterium]
MENGMHPVDMIMQQTTLCDDVIVDVQESDSFSILIKTNNTSIPTDSANIAFRAAERMIEKYQEIKSEEAEATKEKMICIFIEKHIPVAAGLAGGSGNAAAVIHALNAIWELDLSLSELCDIGKTLGSDVPFCIMGQAKENKRLPRKVRDDKLAVSCARARGTGTELTPVTPLRAYIIIVKPDIEVSTAEVYRGIDSCNITVRPNNDILEEKLKCHSMIGAVPEMINVLENYTLNEYPKVGELKDLMKEKMTGARCVLMSGSGPSVFAIFDDELAAIEDFKEIKYLGYEVHLCKAK